MKKNDLRIIYPMIIVCVCLCAILCILLKKKVGER